MDVQNIDIPEKVKNSFLEEGIEHLNPPQEQAVQNGVLEGRDMVVASPTASGKTLIAELALSKNTVESDGKTVYIVPLKALASEKFQDFKERYSDQEVRIAVGDYDSDGERLEAADIIIATSEKLDSIMRHNPAWTSTIDLVVVDEIHLLNSPNRGPTLEITITKLRDTIDFQFLGLSATISNAKSMSDWLNAEHIESDYRPVDLEQAVASDNKLQFFPGDSADPGNPGKGGFSTANEHETLEPLKEQELKGSASNTTVRTVEDTLKKDKQAIIFCSSRKGAEKSSDRNAEPTSQSISREEKRELDQYADRIRNALGNPTAQCKRLADNVENGSAFHHAGLCLAPESVVMHPDGTFSTIEELVEGGKQKCLGMSNREIHETEITGKYEMDQKPVLQVRTEKGRSVKVSRNHQLPVKQGQKIEWTKAKNLVPGNRVACPSKLDLYVSDAEPVLRQDRETGKLDQITEELAWAIGYVSSALDPENMQKFDLAASDHTNKLLRVLRTRFSVSTKKLSENRVRVRCPELSRKLSDLCVVEGKVRMPDVSLPEKYLRKYIAGFVRSSRPVRQHFSKDTEAEISTNNNVLANELQSSLLRLGITASKKPGNPAVLTISSEAEPGLEKSMETGASDGATELMAQKPVSVSPGTAKQSNQITWEEVESVQSLGTEKLYDISTGTQNFVANSMVAHNTTEQRNLVEEAFEKGIVKTVSATPTLAAGVNLPAFRVIIRDLKRYTGDGMDWIPVLEYNQMTGRAGRPGYDDRGEAVSVAKNPGQNQEIVDRYIQGQSEKIRSKLASEPVLRMHVLSLISSKYCKTKPQIFEFFQKTFYAHQFGDFDEIKSKIEKTIQDLRDYGFVKDQDVEATRTGRRVAELYIDPDSAHHMITSMKSAARSETRPISYLYMIARTSEMSPRPSVKNSEASEMERALQDARTYLLENIPEEWDPSYEIHLESMKLALTLRSWISEVDEEKIMEKYGIAPGGIRSKNKNADWLLYSAQELSDLEELGQRKPLERLRRRIKHGIKEELLSLVKYDQIGRVRARKLYEHGIDTQQMIRETNFEKLKKLIGDSTARKLKKQVGEENIFDREKITDYFD